MLRNSLIRSENHYASVVWTCRTELQSRIYVNHAPSKIAFVTKCYEFHAINKCDFLIMPRTSDIYKIGYNTQLVKLHTSVVKFIIIQIMTTQCEVQCDISPLPVLNQFCLIVDWTLRNKLHWYSNRNKKKFIHTNAFQSVVCEMPSILSGGRWVKMDHKSQFHK